MTSISLPRPDEDQRNHVLAWGTSFVIVALAGMPYLMLGRVEPYTVIVPVAATAIAVALYAVSRPLYFGFTLWMWFLAPFIRRLVDYGIGAYTESSLIIATPSLVGLVGVLGLLKVLTEESRGARQAFWLAVIAMVYGAGVGLVVNGPTAMAIGALDWGVPLVMSALLLVDWRQYLRYREVVLRTLVVGMGVLGVYGIYQFLVLPPWDRLWMESIDMTTIGRPFPGQFRAFGMLNSPLPFGLTLVVGLLGLFAVRSQGILWRMLAGVCAVPALVSLMLTQSRTAWGAAVIGLLYIMLRAHARSRRAIVLYVILASLAAGPLLLYRPVAVEVADRVGSLGSLEDDGSANARMAHFESALPFILAYPSGGGFGSLGRAGRVGSGAVGTGSQDSGILTILFTLGWLGTLLYGLGLGLLCLWAWRAARGDPGGDRFPVVASSIAAAVLSAIPLGNTFAEVGGVYMWGFLALALAGARYHHGGVGVPMGREEAPAPAPV